MKKRFLSKKAAGVAMAAVLAAGAIPCGNVFADEVNVPETGSASRLVQGKFSITDEELIAMGYGPMVSIPLSISMSYNGTGECFQGEGTIYGYGLIDDDKCIVANVDTSHAKYGKVYNSANVDVTRAASGASTYDLEISLNLWDKSDCQANMEAVWAGSAIPNPGEIMVSVDKTRFIPSGAGAYKTYAPIVVSLEDE